MDHYIGDLLDKRYEYLVVETRNHISDSTGKSVIDLVLQARIKEGNSISHPNKLDPEFRLFAIRQVQLFLSLLDVTRLAVPFAILENLTSLNGLLYTTAVIKETLRLFSPASASREGFESETVINDTGKTCSINGIFILTLHTELQRNPLHWVDPDTFIPERFLAKSDEKLYPPRTAWRPFEKGIRNCLAEGLVITELKVLLAIVSTGFDFETTYNELDAMGGKVADKWKYQGERAYQIEEGAAHPCERMTVRARVRRIQYCIYG